MVKMNLMTHALFLLNLVKILIVMNKKVYCILPKGQDSNPAVLKLIGKYRVKHALPEIIIISPEDLKSKKIELNLEEIKMHTELILKSIDEYEPDPCERLPNEEKYRKEQNKYRERNYKSNYKSRR
jgi:hypothetical protein